MGHFFNNFASWSDLWTASLWRASWQGAIAVAVVWAIARWRGFLSPRVVCWLWRLVCLKFLLALLWAQPVPLRVLPAAPPAKARATPPVSSKTSAAVAMPVAAPPVAGASEPGDVARPVGVRQAGVDFSVILSLLWLAGVFYAAGRIAKSWNMPAGWSLPPGRCRASRCARFAGRKPGGWACAVRRRCAYRRLSEAQEAACDELLIQRRVAMPVEYGRLLLKLAAREPWPSRSALATAGVLGTFPRGRRA